MTALRLLGTSISVKDDGVSVVGGELKPRGIIDCKGSASTLRMLSPIVAAKPSYAVYTGDEGLRRRPIRMLEEALKSLGVEAYSNSGRPPLLIDSKGFKSNSVTLDASESSQHVSGFAIAGARLGQGFSICLKDRILVSKPYVNLTLKMLRMHGIEASLGEEGLRVEPGELKPFDHTVPGDYSLSAIPMAMAAISGGRIEVKGLVNEPQPDREVIEMMSEMGLRVFWSGNTLIAENPGRIKPCILDCSNNPDLVPALTLIATAAEGTTVFRNVGRLEVKESARATLITEGLSKMGAKVFFKGEDIVIEGTNGLRGSTVNAGGDHRIEMMLIVAGAVAEGETTILNAGAISKSNPDFYSWLAEVGVELEWG